AKGKGACWGFEAVVVGRVWRVVEWQVSGDECVEVFGGKRGRYEQFFESWAKGKGACWGFEAVVVGRVWRVVEWQVSGDECVEVFGGKRGRQHGKSESDSYYLSDRVINSFTRPLSISS
nr:hypothetical protein [Tanacetum cinerariifolium]